MVSQSPLDHSTSYISLLQTSVFTAMLNMSHAQGTTCEVQYLRPEACTALQDFMKYQQGFTPHLVTTLFKVTDDTKCIHLLCCNFKVKYVSVNVHPSGIVGQFHYSSNYASVLCLLQVQLTKTRTVPPQCINSSQKTKPASVMKESCSSRLAK